MSLASIDRPGSLVCRWGLKKGDSFKVYRQARVGSNGPAVMEIGGFHGGAICRGRSFRE